MTTATETIRGMESVMKGAGQRVIGAVVMWSLGGVHVRRDALRDALDDMGLGAAMGRDPGPEGVLQRAAKSVSSKGLIVRHRRRGSYAIVEEQNLGEGQPLRHRHTITVRVRCDANDVKTIVAEDESGEEPSQLARVFAERILAECDDVLVHANSEDLSRVLVRAVAGAQSDVCLGGLSLRDKTGGVYWVPGPSVDRLRKLQAFVDGLKGYSRIQVLTLYGDADNLREAAETARASFTSQLNELREELQAFVASCREGDKGATDHNIRTRVKRLQRLRDRVDLWSDALGGVQADLVQRIEDAKQEVAEQLGL